MTQQITMPIKRKINVRNIENKRHYIGGIFYEYGFFTASF